MALALLLPGLSEMLFAATALNWNPSTRFALGDNTLKEENQSCLHTSCFGEKALSEQKQARSSKRLSILRRWATPRPASSRL